MTLSCTGDLPSKHAEFDNNDICRLKASKRIPYCTDQESVTKSAQKKGEEYRLNSGEHMVGYFCQVKA